MKELACLNSLEGVRHHCDEHINEYDYGHSVIDHQEYLAHRHCHLG